MSVLDVGVYMNMQGIKGYLSYSQWFIIMAGLGQAAESSTLKSMYLNVSCYVAPNDSANYTVIKKNRPPNISDYAVL